MKTFFIYMGMMAALPGFAGAARAQGIQPLLATYDANKSVTRTGTITELTWANTHCVLFIDTKSDDGKPVNVAIEMTNPRTLIALHVTPVTLQPGKEVSVVYSPSTDPPNRGLVRTLSMNGKLLFDASKLNSELQEAAAQAGKPQPKVKTTKKQ